MQPQNNLTPGQEVPGVQPQVATPLNPPQPTPANQFVPDASSTQAPQAVQISSVPASSPQPAAQPVQQVQPVTALPPSPYANGGGMVVGGEPTPLGTNTDWVVDPASSGGNSGGFKKWIKPLAIGGGILGALAIIGGGYYFGYYTNANLLYSQALKNTGKGYDKLLTYSETQAKTDIKGFEGQGSYKVDADTMDVSGNLSMAGDDKSGNFKLDVKTDGKTYTFETLVIDNKKKYPDIFFKIGGIAGVADSYGSPELSAKINAYDNAWIAVDEQYLSELEKSAKAEASEDAEPTDEEVIDALKAAGKVNEEYLYSTKEDKRVLEVKEKLGVETVDGHKAHHYMLSVNKDNLKKYIAAQKKAIYASKLKTWINKKDNKKTVDEAFASAEDGVKDIKSSDTFDLWADLNKRIVYKMRFSDKDNKANNYVDLGLDYTGGKTYPFFMSGKSKENNMTTEGKAVATVNTDDNSVKFEADIDASGASGGNFSGDFNIKPSTKQLKLTAPANPKMLSQVMTDLGFGQMMSPASGTLGSKNQKKAGNPGLAYFVSEIEKYSSKTGKYPTLAEIKTPGWRVSNTPGLQQYFVSNNTAGTAGWAAATKAGQLQEVKDAFVGTPLESLPFWR